MDVSNSTGQNTDYRVASGGGGGVSYQPSLKGKAPLHRLPSKSHHKNVRPPAGKGPWIIEFFKVAGSKGLLASAEIKDATCLVILVETGQGCGVVVTKPSTRATKPRQTPPQKGAGAAAEASASVH